MSDTRLEKKMPSALKEKGQYFLAFLVITSMLIVTNIPVFVVFFFGIFIYFVIRMFAPTARNETREIFEFYLSANDILRDDDRRWFGFEIQETIERGESVLKRMSAAPPLVRFTLGALYNKFGDHKAAVNYLSQVIENPHSEELAFVYPTPELRNYVRILRKIEREPGDAPLTSAAVRALERARRIRGNALLEESRSAFATGQPMTGHALEQAVTESRSSGNETFEGEPVPATIAAAFAQPADLDHDGNKHRPKKGSREAQYANRQPITDVLHDIYDRNVG